MGTQVEIENNDHFLELTKEFDKKHRTQTYFAELTLNQIWKYFYKTSHKDIRWWANTPTEYTDKILTSKLKEMFEDTGRTVVYNTDNDITEGMIGKINSMYMMRRDILSGKGLIDPMCVSMFPNLNSPVHPGGTRMNWANHYDTPLKVIVTNYSMRMLFEPKPIEEFDFDLEGKGFYFMVGNSVKDPDWLSYKKGADTLNITYKQIQNISKEYYRYLRPNEIDEQIKFELSGETLLVNDSVLAINDGMWKLVLE